MDPKQAREQTIHAMTTAFLKIDQDRLPKDITGEQIADIFPELFNRTSSFLVSASTLARRYSAHKQKTEEEKEKAMLATALWWAVTANANPYKISIGTMLFWEPRQKEIFQAIDKIFTPLAGLLASLEKDRVKLSTLGAY